jgi:hypothetical protein
MSEAPEKMWFTKVGKDIVPNSEKRLPEDTEYTRADLHTAAMERAYIAGLEAAEKRLSQMQVIKAEHDYSKGYSDGAGDCLNAVRALKDPAHVKAAVAKLTEGGE